MDDEPVVDRLLCIDPGTIKAGYALYVDGVLDESGCAIAEGDKFDRCEEIARHLFYIMQSTQASRIISEYPFKAGKGMESGNITILFHFCGMLHAYANSIAVPIEFVEPAIWKGNVPKKVHHPKLIRKVKKKYERDISKYTEDTLDAVGIGWWDIWERKD